MHFLKLTHEKSKNVHFLGLNYAKMQNDLKISQELINIEHKEFQLWKNLTYFNYVIKSSHMMEIQIIKK